MNSVARFHWTAKRVGQMMHVQQAFFGDHHGFPIRSAIATICSVRRFHRQGSGFQSCDRHVGHGAAGSFDAVAALGGGVSGDPWPHLATLSGPHSGPANAWGDVFLEPGQALRVPVGQRLVLESLAGRGEAAACFDWEASSTLSPWQQLVGEPLAELRQSLAGVGRAAGHLVQGLGRLAWTGVTGKGLPVVLDTNLDTPAR